MSKHSLISISWIDNHGLIYLSIRSSINDYKSIYITLKGNIMLHNVTPSSPASRVPSFPRRSLVLGNKPYRRVWKNKCPQNPQDHQQLSQHLPSNPWHKHCRKRRSNNMKHPFLPQKLQVATYSWHFFSRGPTHIDPSHCSEIRLPGRAGGLG